MTKQIKLTAADKANVKKIATIRTRIRKHASDTNSVEYKAAVKELSDFVAGK